MSPSPLPSPDAARAERVRRGVRAAQAGLVANTGLVVVKVVAGIVGHSYALVADGVESSMDVFSSLVVWRGLRVSGRSADDAFHFGYGKAEALSAVVVAVLLLGAAVGITVASVREILTPHHLPAPWTLAVLVGVVAIKAVLSRRVKAVGEEIGSGAVEADAWHHLSDALTSAAAFVGITVALVGGPGWEAADDWAALAAAGIIAANGIRAMRGATAELMDRAPAPPVLAAITDVAAAVPGVLATEKLRARPAGLGVYVDLHVQADPDLSLHDAHALGGRVKRRIREAVPEVLDVLVHMEPFEPGDAVEPAADAD